MKRIPKQFQLLGHTITVRVVSKRDWEDLCDKYEEMEDTVGWWVPADDLIVIQRQPRAQMLHTLMHEMTHAVLHYMNDPKATDERYVDQMGALWAQALATAR